MKKFAITLFILLSVISITKATENYYMFKSTSYTVCSGNFYDGEGPLDDYLTNQDVTVTLYPATTGAKISVTFDSFNTLALYSDTYYNTRSDILYIYNGNSISSPQIGAMQGVGYGTVTSTAIDGSLTFRFISYTPRLSSSVGAKAGWSAKISCNPTTPNDITMIGGTFTTSGGNFYDGGGPNGDYWSNQNTTLTLYPATPGAKVSVTFDSFNTQVLYSDAYYNTKSDILYVYNGNSTSAPQIGAMQGVGYGTVTSTASDGSLTFQFVSDAPRIKPVSGTRTGWTATITCSSVPPNDITMIGGTFTTSGGNFYDAGGPNGDYMSNQNTTLTLYPATPGAKLSVSFDLFNTQVLYSDAYYNTRNDILYVYNGNSTSAPQIGALQGEVGYGTILSTADDGSLTFQFVSNAPRITPASGTRTGWSATISCSSITPKDITMIAGTAFTTNGGRFFDSGGPNGDYMNNQNTSLTLYPATPGAKVSITFDSFNTQVLYSDSYYNTRSDILSIYDGNSISAPQIGELKGKVDSRTYNSTATDGSLTFKFVSFAPRIKPVNGIRAGWSATIAGNMNSTIYVNPNLFISAPQVKPGQTITFSGTQFSQAGKVDLDFTGPEKLNLITDYSIDVSGDFKYTLTIPSTQVGGSYQVTATDKTSGISRTRSFQIVQNQSTVVDNFLRIVEPNMSKIRLVGDPITLAWEDQVKFNVNPLYNLKHSYKVEYKKDANNSSGAWQLIKDAKGSNPGYGKINLSTTYTPTDPGTYIFRISDNYYPNRSATTPELVVSGSLDQGARVEFKWDYNSKVIGSSPEGAAADGVARFYLVVSNSNPLSSPIQKVTVSLSDPEDYRSTQFLGKLMKCSYQSDDKFIPEADNANSISAENNTPNSKGQCWFWYVAPDDFSRNQGDWDKGERLITATINITFVNGKNLTTPIKKEIKIVRPPLMLVHGLNDYPSTWNNFQIGSNYPLYYNDTRFKVKNAIRLEPTSSFDVNASHLLAGINDQASFLNMINKMQLKGYACNQVDYVCHSMGGSILREAAEFTSTYYSTSNYGKGFVNKFITLDTPNQGSSLANVLDDVAKMWILTSPLISSDVIFNSIFPKDIPKFWEIQTFKIKVTDAVSDLKYLGGKKFGITNVNSHLIGGSVSCSSYNSKTQDFLSKIFSFVVGFSKYTFCGDLNLYFLLHGYEPDFIDASDVVVSRTSQFSGYTGNTLPDFCTQISGIVHSSSLGVSPIESHDVWDKVDNLLNAKVNSPLFSESLPATTVPTTKSVTLATQKPLAVVEDRIKILYPLPNAVYNAGDTLTIKLQVDTLGLQSFALFFQDQCFFDKPTKPNLEYKLIISPEYLEGQSISILGGYSNSGVSSLSNASIDLTVKPVGSIIDFNVTPEVFMIEKSKSRRPDYEAIFPNAIAQIGYTDQLTVKINDPSILAYDNATNQFKGLAKGSTQATITYKGITKTVFFEIVQYEEPVGDPISGIDDIRLDKKDQLNVKVYPNPFTNELTIELEGNTQKVDFEIINSLGQSVLSGSVFEKTIVQTTNFASGIYLIKLKSGTTFEFKKIIK
jgi:hypothetical protein